MNSALSSAKMAAAHSATKLVLPNMRIGLGSGSTAALFIEALGQRCREGLQIEAIASSKASEELAKTVGIPLLNPDTVVELDLTIDGADEIDPQKRMIKGGGGALLREKILAQMSREMVVIVDASKRVQALGAFPLAVEIVPFAYPATLAQLERLGLPGEMRKGAQGALFITDSGHYICDLHLGFPCQSPESVERNIRAIPGVVETGLFLTLAGRVLIGYPDGHVEIQE